MEVIPSGRPDAAGRKLSVDTLDSDRSLGENLRKEQTVVRMWLGGGGEPPHRCSEAVHVRVLDDMEWETHCQNTRQKRC